MFFGRMKIVLNILAQCRFCPEVSTINQRGTVVFASSTPAYDQSMQLLFNRRPQLPQPSIWSDLDDEHEINRWPLLSTGRNIM